MENWLNSVGDADFLQCAGYTIKEEICLSGWWGWVKDPFQTSLGWNFCEMNPSNRLVVHQYVPCSDLSLCTELTIKCVCQFNEA